MAKNIIIDCRSTPEQLGYKDRITVLGEDPVKNEVIQLYHEDCSTCPNPYKPASDPDGRKPWERVYAWIRPGRYTWRCFRSPRHGKCLQLNDGGPVPTRNANQNHRGEYVAYAIEIHEGDSPIWRGSAGCCTIAPGQKWQRFISLFDLEEVGALDIIERKVPCVAA
jgi:hypothetical protein